MKSERRQKLDRVCIERAQRYRAIVSAPVISVPRVPLALGASLVDWPEKAYDAVYLAKDEGGTIKIGYSENPAWRVYNQGLFAAAFLTRCGRKHEAWLHSFFADERVGWEFFRGPRVEAFVVSIANVAERRAGECAFAAYFEKRMPLQERTAAKRAA